MARWRWIYLFTLLAICDICKAQSTQCICSSPVTSITTAFTTTTSSTSTMTSLATTTTNPTSTSLSPTTLPTTSTTTTQVTSTSSTVPTTTTAPTSTAASSTTTTSSAATTTAATSSIATTISACAQATVSIQLVQVSSDQIQVIPVAQNGPTGAQFNVTLSQGNSVVNSSATTSGSTVTFPSLLPATQYTITVKQLSCPNNADTSNNVTTAGQVIAAAVKIQNIPFTADMSNTSSPAYTSFATSFIASLIQSLPADIQALIASGQLVININSLTNGSIIVSFTIVASPSANLTVSNVSQSFTTALTNNTNYTVDPASLNFTAQNLCATANPCSVNANCTSINGVASCQCLSGFNDTSPSVPGITCVGKRK
ncbi:cell wall protein DAN4-like [Xenopus tropicalis]|uniref:Cell wall protein DAN4-like n=1 Tax=Xenopus tropicalis TaxID=8364 RepID=A0A8J1J2G2_XENTR|nr:cell wall protein DAN4-like [Xenopus tropicalis]